AQATSLATSVLGMFVLTVCGTPLVAQATPPGMTSNHPVGFAVSPPLRELGNLPSRNRYRLPEDEAARHVDFHPGRVARPVVDPVEQSTPGRPSNIVIGLSLAGIGRDPSNGYPGRPDTNAAVGDAQVVEWVNVRLAVYNKSTGAQELGPLDGNLIWQNLGGP